MTAETITVYIDPQQLAAQKDNNYSLFLAKMVNGQFTVIWQANGPFATPRSPAYEYLNTFPIGVPNYQVNYGTVGGGGFTAAGVPQAIEIGQSVALDQDGVFETPTGGMSGQITIFNQLPGNPNAALFDNAGNLIFANVDSGMDIGMVTLAPVDTYQLWFGGDQGTGTIIAFNVSNSTTVTFGGGEANAVVSYTAQGQWQSGPLGQVQSTDQAPV
jgi:hypothetical protein